MDSWESLTAKPFAEAKAELDGEGINYTTEITRPTRDFFKTDENNLYVVRVKQADGRLLLTLAGKQMRKER